MSRPGPPSVLRTLFVIGFLLPCVKLKTVSDPAVVRSLKERFARLRPETTRRWGSLTPHEMLCHLGDAWEMVLRTRPRATPLPERSRPLVRAIGLWSPMRWPHGRPTNPMHDPRVDGTRPTDFGSDLARALAGIERIAAAPEEGLEPMHGVLGRMSRRDWQRWTYKHADHHLRQFGL